MVLTRSLKDPRATAVSAGGRDSGHEMTAKVLEHKSDAKGPVFSVGRGETDPGITYLSLFNTGGTRCYIFPNAAGNGVTCTTTKP